MEFPRYGGCQCGQVRYVITEAPIAIYACHCSECQRQSGSAFGMTVTLRREAFQITTGQLRYFARIGYSGYPLVGGFCPSCGTRIAHFPGRRPDNVNLKPGTLDNREWLQPHRIVWASSRQPWAPLPENIPIHEEQGPGLGWLTAAGTNPEPPSLEEAMLRVQRDFGEIPIIDAASPNAGTTS